MTTDIETLHERQQPGKAKLSLENSAPSPERVEACHGYLTTVEAAHYLRHSVSWLLRQGDIPYLPGRPNLYAIADLDDWFERSKRFPKV